MKRNFYPFWLFVAIIFFSCLSDTFASHIVGGELNYKCLGNDQYEISLVVYRDCFNGNPGAYFDNPAYIGIYNSSDVLVDSLSLPWKLVDDTLQPTLTDSCLILPGDVCVHTTFYVDTVELTPITGGYTLIYQRCCRNMTINNIVLPEDTGASFTIGLTERAMQECNSSATFIDWPPIFICVNEPIFFDHSAVDIDGDSIVYKLCTPLDGATDILPYPEPYEQTIPNEIIWESAYSVDDMLGGVPLEIDPQTGILTGVPSTTGQFVVGVCVEEYRDGELISTTRRDFQYNIRPCIQTTAAFFAPSIQCGDFTVDFDNQSINSENFLWFFNDPNSSGDTSVLENPAYTYSDTGSYEVTLIVEPFSPCADTFSQIINLQYASLFPAFDVEYLECTDTAVIQLTDLSTDTISEIISWDWRVYNTFGEVATSNEQNPQITLTESGTYFIELTVASENGCEEIITVPFILELVDDISPVGDTLVVCLGDSVQLNPFPNLDYNYIWSPEEGLSDPFAPNPLVFPDSTTIYTVNVSVPNSICAQEFELVAFVPEPVQLELPLDTIICAPSIDIEAVSNTGQQFEWSTNVNFDTIIGVSSGITLEPVGPSWYFAKVKDGFDCEIVDSVLIDGRAVRIEVAENLVICPNDTIDIEINNLVPTDILSYLWSPDSLVIGSVLSSMPQFSESIPGTYWLYVDVINQFDCEAMDSLSIGVLDTTPQLDFVFFQQCGGFSVQFTNESINAPYYLWDFGDPTASNDTSTLENPEYVYPDTGFYTVSLTVNADVECKDTIFKTIYVKDPQIFVDFDWDIVDCSDTISIQFSDSSSNFQSNIVGWEWIFSTGDTILGQNATIQVDSAQILTASLFIQSDDGCEDSLSVSIPVEPLTISIPDSAFLCPNIPTELNPGADSSLSYIWTPSTGLDDPFSPNPVATLESTTSYTITIFDVNGLDTCLLEQQFTAVVSPLILELNLPEDTLLCDTTPITLSAGGAGINELLWFDDPDFSSPLGSGSELLLEDVDKDTIYVQAFDSLGCYVSDQVVIDYQPISIELVAEQPACIGDTVRVNAINNGSSDIINYEWRPPFALISGQGTSTATFIAEFSLNVTLNVESDKGCIFQTSIPLVPTGTIPSVEATAEPDTIFSSGEVQLEATFEENYEYSWTPGSTLDDPNVWNPVASPTETTFYTVTAINEDGCPATAEVRIVVLQAICKEPFVYLPNIFSPDGDGLNDILLVRGNIIDEVFLQVYNRWGELVFETDRQDSGWDGTFKGKALTSDVFGYYLRVRCINGEILQQKGNVTLIR